MNKLQKNMVSRISDADNDWLQRTRRKIEQRKRRERNFLKCAACAALIGGAVLLSGYVSQEGNKVTEVYTVKPGDTLRTISEAYLEKETANKRYILEFEHDIEQLNPSLQEDSTIYPGQEIRIEYFTK